MQTQADRGLRYGWSVAKRSVAPVFNSLFLQKLASGSALCELPEIDESILISLERMDIL